MDGASWLVLITLVVGAVALVAASAPQLAAIAPGLRLGGLALMLTTVLMLVSRGFGRWRFARQLRRLKRRVADKHAATLITHDALDVVWRNDAAQAHYGAQDLAAILGRFVAYPEGQLFALRARVDRGAPAQAQFAGRDTRVQLRVMRGDGGLLCWEISEERLDAEAWGAQIWALRADEQGRVLACSPALAVQLGQQPARLEDVFATQVQGEGARLRGGHLDSPVTLHEIPQPDGVKLIVLTPNSAQGQDPIAPQGEFDHLPVPMLRLSLDGTVRHANAGAHRLLHSDIGPGARLSDFVEGLGRPMKDWLADAATRDRPAQPEFLRGAAKHKNLFLQITLSPSSYAPGEEVIAVLQDVTEFKVLEAQFVQSQKMQAIGQLAGGVAHDFNNLLTAISGHCDLLLLRHGADDPDYADLIQIHQNANRAAALVGQLLAYSRKQELRLEEVDLRDSLADLTHLLNRLVGERVHLSLSHDPDIGCVMADKRQLEQVIMNLVVNARDAMEEGGEIEISTEYRDLSEPHLRDQATVAPGKWALIRVRDHGCGIAPEMLPHIFEPFYTTKSVGEGTGLGLSTAYGIVKQSGGFIFVDSVPGDGTTFTLYLPAVAPTAPDELMNIAPDTSARVARPSVVLLVEDEAPVRAFAARALALKGYEVLEADCGEAALDLLQSEPSQIDLIVSDVVMPGIDGPTWVRQAQQTHPDVRVIFMSGYSENSIREDRAAIDGAAFLPKPFALKDLLSAVQDQLAD